jgi:hypothetical protein
MKSSAKTILPSDPNDGAIGAEHRLVTHVPAVPPRNGRARVRQRARANSPISGVRAGHFAQPANVENYT